MRWQSVAVLHHLHALSALSLLSLELFVCCFLRASVLIFSMSMARPSFFFILSEDKSVRIIRFCICVLRRCWHSLCPWLTKATSESKCKHITASQVSRTHLLSLLHLRWHFYAWALSLVVHRCVSMGPSTHLIMVMRVRHLNTVIFASFSYHSLIFIFFLSSRIANNGTWRDKRLRKTCTIHFVVPHVYVSCTFAHADSYAHRFIDKQIMSHWIMAASLHCFE